MSFGEKRPKRDRSGPSPTEANQELLAKGCASWAFGGRSRPERLFARAIMAEDWETQFQRSPTRRLIMHIGVLLPRAMLHKPFASGRPGRRNRTISHTRTGDSSPIRALWNCPFKRTHAHFRCISWRGAGGGSGRHMGEAAGVSGQSGHFDCRG